MSSSRYSHPRTAARQAICQTRTLYSQRQMFYSGKYIHHLRRVVGIFPGGINHRFQTLQGFRSHFCPSTNVLSRKVRVPFRLNGWKLPHVGHLQLAAGSSALRLKVLEVNRTADKSGFDPPPFQSRRFPPLLSSLQERLRPRPRPLSVSQPHHLLARTSVLKLLPRGGMRPFPHVEPSKCWRKRRWRPCTLGSARCRGRVTAGWVCWRRRPAAGSRGRTVCRAASPWRSTRRPWGRSTRSSPSRPRRRGC